MGLAIASPSSTSLLRKHFQNSPMIYLSMQIQNFLKLGLTSQRITLIIVTLLTDDNRALELEILAFT